jgi:hypothetical protein
MSLGPLKHISFAIAYGAALLLSVGWHDHHESESADEHFEHIIGQGAHNGVHIDSLPNHDAEHHGLDCPACVFLSQHSGDLSGPGGAAPSSIAQRVLPDIAETTGWLVETIHSRGPPVSC